MAQKLKVVFDTNVYLAAALNPSGPSEAWLRIAGRQARSFDLYVSQPILDEVKRKLIDKFQVASTEAGRFVAAIRSVAIVVVPTETVRIVSDPDDDMLFECALAAGAQLLVSADKAVLKLNPYHGIGVCHPRDLKLIFAQDLKYA
jgi:putative PIN family toxin of toxin-antitoxin system